MRGSSLLRRFALAGFACAGLMLAPGFVAAASAADFNPGAGTYTVDTTNLTITGPGTNVSGTDQAGIAVFSFDNANIPAGAVLVAKGKRPLELEAAGSFTLAGTIDADGTSATVLTAGPNAGGAGGGAGGTDDSQAGAGPGGGQPGSTTWDGGGGGGFGGSGAAGGSDHGPGGAGGAAYGDLNAGLQGGSGGGGSTNASDGGQGGGGGGGAVELRAASLTIDAGGKVIADGGTGYEGYFGASGGGSGGAILLHANTLSLAGSLSAKGGAGGAGGCCADGGGGGGGRIAYEYETFSNSGTASVSGGASGSAGVDGHGKPSPEATGAIGVVTQVQAPTVTTGAATSIVTGGATLNGIVNANGSATTYQFQYGTTTAYGNSIPLAAALIGSDTVNHAVSVLLSGLAAGTTYHYRIVATDQAGFTTTGSDTTFTTAKSSSGAKPAIENILTAAVGATSATLKAVLASGGVKITYHFEYGTTTHYTNSTTVKTLTSSGHAVSISSLVKGLRPGSRYRFRLVVHSPSTTVRSAARTFTTRAQITVTGLSGRISKSKSIEVIRIRATSHLGLRGMAVLVGHQRVASSKKSSLTLRLNVSKLAAGGHTLTVVTTGAGGITRRTLRFSVVAGSPSFTG